MSFKLIAIDMDGTLLNSQNEVSQRTRRAIEAASEKGVYVVLATGRILKSATNYSDDLNLYKPIIASNGALIVDENKNILYEKTMDKSIVEKIIELGTKNQIYYHLYSEDSFYSRVYVEEIAQFYNTKSMAKSEINFKLFKEPREIIEDKDLKIFKFIFIDEDSDKLNRFRNELNTLGNLNICSSWSNNIEVMDREVSKGNSLRYLSKILNIPREQIIAIGDNENDLSMIDYAGLGVAMGNGEEIVKSAADMITSTNDEDGVAKVIEKYILGIGD
ncbi:Cof-type HAD-IIB family hydrolase [Wansuia hejianensis]|uniref:HAD family phosphatase n=1 Tax=Wansuia hejianensis TaxID=2763667 RepID=A0A926IMR3_9FIRM|nr:HAD family phosphatase [Wansuia hejianensis]